MVGVGDKEEDVAYDETCRVLMPVQEMGLYLTSNKGPWQALEQESVMM